MACRTRYGRVRATDAYWCTTATPTCRSGGRSAALTDSLRRAGFDAVNIAGGMRAWAAAGHGVVSESGSSGAVI
jgi:hypothetical protein